MNDPGWGYSFFLPALILNRAHTSQWHIVGVKNMISFSCCLLFSPHSIPFLFTPSSSRHWMRAKQNVDPDSPASVVKMVARPHLGPAAQRDWLWGAVRQHPVKQWLMLWWNLDRSLSEIWEKLSLVFTFWKNVRTLSPRVSKDTVQWDLSSKRQDV